MTEILRINLSDLSEPLTMTKTNSVIILVQFRIYDAEELASNLGPEPGEGSNINPRYLDNIIVVINNDAPITLYQCSIIPTYAPDYLRNNLLIIYFYYLLLRQKCTSNGNNSCSQKSFLDSIF